jgi:hypothetical protein
MIQVYHMTLEHATHTTHKITRFDSEEWLNYNKKERSKPLKNEPNCLKPGSTTTKKRGRSLPKMCPTV